MALNLRSTSILTSLAVSLSLVACGGQTTTTTAPASPNAASPAATTSSGSGLTGRVLVDGSSTVFPISEAMAEEFQKQNPGVKVTVGVSGTGGGFKKFCNGETDISNASRPIKPEEVELCKKGNVEYIELPISYDGLSVVVNPQNTWATCLTVEELKKMWEPAAQGKVTRWSQIREGFPDEPLALFGAGTDSGTYDYFTKAITGDEGKSRGDYTASEDDNTLVQGVAGSKNALGFFGFAYYEQNQDKLKLVQINHEGKGCVAPSSQTITDGTYQPLARPEFIYVRKESATKPEVKAFVEFTFNPANKKLISEVGYVPLPDELYGLVMKRFEKGTVGSMFAGKGSKVNAKLADLLKSEGS